MQLQADLLGIIVGLHFLAGVVQKDDSMTAKSLLTQLHVSEIAIYNDIYAGCV